MSTIAKSDRIQIRVGELAKNKVERAARVAHKSVSESISVFVRIGNGLPR